MNGSLQPEVVPKTASFTLDPNNLRSGTVITNRGASGAVVCTLPTLSDVRSWRGYHVDYVGVADQNFTFAAAAGKAVCKNNAAATSLAASTSSEKIGARMRAQWDGTKWLLNMLELTGTVA